MADALAMKFPVVPSRGTFDICFSAITLALPHDNREGGDRASLLIFYVHYIHIHTFASLSVSLSRSDPRYYSASVAAIARKSVSAVYGLVRKFLTPSCETSAW